MTENSLETEIISRIKRAGKISFAEFMEIALYDKEGGYYTKPDVFGAEGDFFTSPAAHPIFGALLAVQLKVVKYAEKAPNSRTPFKALVGIGKAHRTSEQDRPKVKLKLRDRGKTHLQLRAKTRTQAKANR